MGSEEERSSKLSELEKKYRKIRNDTKQTIVDYEQKLTENIKRDSKSFFKYVRSRQKKKDKVGPLKDADGNLITNDEVTADLLNKYFGSVFTEENIKNIPVASKKFQGDGKDVKREVIFTKSELLRC